VKKFHALKQCSGSGFRSGCKSGSFGGLPELDLLVRVTDPKYCFKELNIFFGGVKASLPSKSFMNKYSIAIVDQLN
jgi:hypothetical protein